MDHTPLPFTSIDRHAYETEGAYVSAWVQKGMLGWDKCQSTVELTLFVTIWAKTHVVRTSSYAFWKKKNLEIICEITIIQVQEKI